MPGPSDSDYSRLPSELLDLQNQLDTLETNLKEHLLANIFNSPVFEWSAVRDNYYGIAGTWTTPGTSDFWGGKTLDNDGSRNLNDQIGLGALFIPITADYTLHMIHTEGSVYGKAHFLLNGVDEGNIDMYDSGSVLNIVKNVSLGSLTAGPLVLSVKMIDKNASSSAYRCKIQSIIIVKT